MPVTANSVLGADCLVLIGTPELDFLPDLQKMLLISPSPPTAGTAGGTALGESPPLAPPEAPPPWAAALVTCGPWAWRRAAGRGRRAAGTTGTEMWQAGWWAPLLLCLLQSVPGRSRLAPPRNVTLFSQNFTVYLTWLPGLGSPPNVTYFVTYQGGASPTHPCAHPDGEDPKGQRHLPAATLHAFAGPEVRGGILEGGRGTQGISWAVLALPLLLPLSLAAAAAAVIWKKLEGDPWFQWVKRPQVMDFSEYRSPMATFQPSGPEFPDDLILCPQKELTIRIRPVPRVRGSGTLQAGPEEDSTEDEEEDTDDSDSIQPYLEPPLFMKEKLQVMGHSETDESGVDSGGSENLSTWDSSDRSWPSTGDSSLKDETGSSSCLDKKEPDQEPDGNGHQEAFPCLEFSEDLGTLEELLKDDLSRWRIWDSLSPKRDLVPGEPPVSLQTLTFSWDSHPEEEEEEEEEEWESEPKGSIASCWDTSSLQRTEVRNGMLGGYMAR
ncbi:interferon lambda receptor 1 isoform X3 [Peromyscus californicus insignis]|uniref:interferon lambda receptor 1 isoform X3 n=1 Tax=Peromyscus californicus insignis TaxID=564181 RepID=UPI0022A75143|nr:interferon lambda receptor 1 isoform X3 [Peromyscus californicus insignis]